MRLVKSLTTIVLLLLLAACKTPQNISYFQDTPDSNAISLQAEKVFRLRPADKINIVVNSKDQSLETLFTLTAPGQRNILGASSQPKTVAGKTTGGGQNTTIAYTVDEGGNIDFPVIGKINVEGMTRQELARYIKNELISRQLVLDPIVTVEYVNIAVSVLGEVSRPGRIDITTDRFTILDAISQAGDLTINGLREDVKVIRDVNGNLKTYDINLCSIQDITSSEGYYLEQNDIVYVTPNDKRKRESLVSGNTMLTPSFWISIASLLTTITALIIR